MVRSSCVKPEAFLPTCIFSTATARKVREEKQERTENRVSNKQQEVRGRPRQGQQERKGGRQMSVLLILALCCFQKSVSLSTHYRTSI